MPTIEVHSQVSLTDDLLKGVKQLGTSELEQFISQVLTLRAKRIAPSFSKQEAEILEKINQGLSLEMQQRYNMLVAKRQTETLTDDEHHELLSLIDQIELLDTERMQAIIELAQLRNLSVSALMATLNIRPPAYG